MSQRWGYVCLSHDPPLISECWFNHGEDVLRDAYLKVRAGEWPDDPRYPSINTPTPITFRTYTTPSPILWLQEHPNCFVSLRNEYGDRLDLPSDKGHPVVDLRETYGFKEAVPGVLIFPDELSKELIAGAEAAWLRAGYTNTPRIMTRSEWEASLDGGEGT